MGYHADPRDYSSSSTVFCSVLARSVSVIVFISKLSIVWIADSVTTFLPLSSVSPGESMFQGV